MPFEVAEREGVDRRRRVAAARAGRVAAGGVVEIADPAAGGRVESGRRREAGVRPQGAVAAQIDRVVGAGDRRDRHRDLGLERKGEQRAAELDDRSRLQIEGEIAGLDEGDGIRVGLGEVAANDVCKRAGLREGDRPGGADHGHRLDPAAAVRRDLDREVVRSGEAEFGAAGIAGLEHEGRVVCRRRLGQAHAHVAVAFVAGGEQYRVAFHRQPVGGVGRGVDAQHAHGGGQVGRRQRLPVGAAPGDEHGLVDKPSVPAGARRVKHPFAVLPRDDVVLVELPGAGGVRADDVAVAVRGIVGGRGKVAVENRELHERIQCADRFVVGDVGLRLLRQDVGNVEYGRAVHVASVSSGGAVSTASAQLCRGNDRRSEQAGDGFVFPAG